MALNCFMVHSAKCGDSMNQYNVTLSNNTVKHVFASTTREACEKVLLLVDSNIRVIQVYQL